MRENYELNKTLNPEMTFHLYNENDCREFIQNNFDEKVLYAYNSLIPCSYKSDLWRFCVLYINGGIYIDIKYKCVNGFTFVNLTDKEYFVKDIPDRYVYTALIVALPGNDVLLQCINQIVENVKNKYYGENPLYPTGPGLLGSYYTQEEIDLFNLYHSCSLIDNKLNEYYIVYNDKIILSFYKKYREEQSKYQKNIHYSELWSEKRIYE